MTDEATIPDLAHPDEVARLLGITPRRVRQVCAERGISSGKRGLVPVGPVVMAVIETARKGRDSDALSTARAARETAKARVLELQVLQIEGRLVDVQEHLEIIDKIAGIFLSGLGSLPARIARMDLKERRRIEGFCNSIQDEIAKAAQQEAEKWSKR